MNDDERKAASAPLEQLVREYDWPTHKFSRINIVTGDDGSLVGSDGTSNSLSNDVDRKILHKIRSGADVVVVGARSVRVEGWQIPSLGSLLVVSRGGFESLPPCPKPERVRVVDLETAVTVCERATHWVCEGGQNLIAQLIQRDLVDELCVTMQRPSTQVSTVTPSLPKWLTSASYNQFLLTSATAHENSLFTRWRRGYND